MSDTVKLIIEIPKEDYNIICKLSNADLLHMPIFNGMALYGIKTGTLFDDTKGEWILAYRECGIEFYLCSKCNEGRAIIDGDFYKSLDEFKKCPICGADMGGGRVNDNKRIY